MASLPNRVYPQTEFREIRTDIVRTVTGSITTRLDVPKINFSTIYTSGNVPTGSMKAGDFVFATGSSGTSAALYFCVKSGSGNAIYTIDGVFFSSGSSSI